MAFILYVTYVLSFFLHLPERIPVLGSIRFDLVILALATVSIFNSRDQKEKSITNETDRMLYILLAYLAVSLPFVEWPGSVLNTGIQNFVKVLPFYFFTTMTVNSEKRLRIFLVVLIGCQTFRVLEPLYLHVTTGYWGDTTFMGEGEAMMDRLAGSPSDTINPNGLAYVIIFLLPFYISFFSYSHFYKILSSIILPVLGYALILTGSRTGFVVAMVIAVAVILKSKKKLLVGVCVALFGITVFGNLGTLQQERYLSIYRADVRGASSAQGRLDGLKEDLEVAMNKPLVGHGLGTSLEANYNVARSTVRSHNLYIEVWQEIGLIGLGIFTLYMRACILAHFQFVKSANASDNRYLISLANALGSWLLANLFFSIASYGLSSYPWYLFGGLTVVLNRFSTTESAKELSLEGV
jgi:putative inorganic carbon (hco3(-)) transporter